MRARASKGAKLSHALQGHKSGDVLLTVTPNDGRYAEKFRVPATEMRRFCWSVLSDLDPVEAAIIAEEEGQDLARLCAGEPAELIDYPPPPAGSKKHRILRLLRDGAHTREAIAARIADAKRPDSLLHELKVTGFVQKIDAGTRGQGLWALTTRGAQLELRT